MDGLSSSKAGWQGGVGKRFFGVNSMGRKEISEPIQLLESLVDIPDEVEKKMNTGSLVAWKILNAVVQGNDEEVLKQLATWVTQVFFLLKVKHHIKDGSLNILTLFRLASAG